MAHYAKLNDDNVVIHISKVDDFWELTDFGELDEEKAVSKLKEWHGQDTRWKKTSYNNNCRRRYASIGGYYDPINDAFIDKKPYDSWKLNQDTLVWEPPIPMPPAGVGCSWIWNEEFLQWDKEDQ